MAKYYSKTVSQLLDEPAIDFILDFKCWKEVLEEQHKRQLQMEAEAKMRQMEMRLR